MSLLVIVHDGPLAGTQLECSHCPKEVRLTVGAGDKRDILNDEGDEPRLDEVVHWYRWDGNPLGYARARGRGGHCTSIMGVVYAPELHDP